MDELVVTTVVIVGDQSESEFLDWLQQSFDPSDREPKDAENSFNVADDSSIVDAQQTGDFIVFQEEPEDTENSFNVADDSSIVDAQQTGDLIEFQEKREDAENSSNVADDSSLDDAQQTGDLSVKQERKRDLASPCTITGVLEQNIGKRSCEDAADLSEEESKRKRFREMNSFERMNSEIFYRSEEGISFLNGNLNQPEMGELYKTWLSFEDNLKIAFHVRNRNHAFFLSSLENFARTARVTQSVVDELAKHFVFAYLDEDASAFENMDMFERLNSQDFYKTKEAMSYIEGNFAASCALQQLFQSWKINENELKISFYVKHMNHPIFIASLAQCPDFAEVILSVVKSFAEDFASGNDFQIF